MQRRHLLRGKLPGGGLHPERTTEELTDAERPAEVAKWFRRLTAIERQIAKAKRDGLPAMNLAGLYYEAANAAMLLDYAQRGIKYDTQAARRNAERLLILDALGE